MKPTVGRIVHFVDYTGEHHAALVTAVGDGPDDVKLTVHPPDDEPRHESNVQHDAKATRAGTWHWPERETYDEADMPPDRLS